MQALLLLEATFATWDLKAKILFQLNSFSAWPLQKEHSDKRAYWQTDGQTEGQTDGHSARQRQRAINHFFVIYAEHQTLPGSRRNNNNNNSWGNLTLPSINANKMSWICLPSRSHCRIACCLCRSFVFVWLSLKWIFQFNSIEMSKCSLIYQFAEDPRPALELSLRKSIRGGRGPWNIMKAINLFCMHLSNW